MTLRVHPDEIVRESTSGLLASHESWERVRLSDIADVLNGFAFKSAAFSKISGVPLLRIRDVGRSTTDTLYDGDYDQAYVVRRGDFVVGMDGDFRAARWVGEDAVLNQRVCKLTVRDHNAYDPSFLAHVLQGYLDAINARTSAVTVKHLSSRTVQEIPLPLPPLNEQRRIVAAIEEHLSRLDAGDTSLAAASRRLAALRVSTLEVAVHSDAPMHPIGELVARDRKVAYGVLQPGPNVEGGVPLVRVGDIEGGRVQSAGLKCIAEDVAGRYPRTALQGGEVLLTVVGSIGRTAVVPESLRGANVARAVAVVPVDGSVSSEYVAMALGRPSAAQQLSGLAHEVARKTLNLEDIRRFQIRLPPLDEQRGIVTRTEEQLSAIDASRTAVERGQRRSASLRRAILERAFRGELVPQDPSDEPASALLERIKAERATAPPRSGRRRVRP